MRRVAVLLVLAAHPGCADDTTPRWQLAQDRIVAVRAMPPHLLPGETARVEALLAAADGPTRVVEPTGASSPYAPAGLFVTVHFNLDHWEINGPDETKLAEARAELGLPDGAAVPLEVTLEFAGPLYADKTVWLGDAHENPTLPRVAIDDVEPPDAGVEVVVVAGLRELLIEVAATDRVRWLTSCGELVDDDTANAKLRVDDPCTGELAVVVRDALGGTVWRVWPLHVQ